MKKILYCSVIFAVAGMLTACNGGGNDGGKKLGLAKFELGTNQIRYGATVENVNANAVFYTDNNTYWIYPHNNPIFSANITMAEATANRKIDMVTASADYDYSMWFILDLLDTTIFSFDLTCKNGAYTTSDNSGNPFLMGEINVSADREKSDMSVKINALLKDTTIVQAYFTIPADSIKLSGESK